jgi:hypothetical protein
MKTIKKYTQFALHSESVFCRLHSGCTQIVNKNKELRQSAVGNAKLLQTARMQRIYSIKSTRYGNISDSLQNPTLKGRSEPHAYAGGHYTYPLAHCGGLSEDGSVTS